jgi:hypothetical protein
LGAIAMIDDYQDILKYYAANIVENVLAVGKIIFKDGVYNFALDNALVRMIWLNKVPIPPEWYT